jgi:hypothetical protein
MRLSALANAPDQKREPASGKNKHLSSHLLNLDVRRPPILYKYMQGKMPKLFSSDFSCLIKQRTVLSTIEEALS